MAVTYLGFVPVQSFAQGAPEMGNTKAYAYQQCGKSIKLQISKTEDGHAVIGLNNKETGELDLFVSPSPFDIKSSFAQFKPVKFDNLSKNLIERVDEDIDIVWGTSHDDNQKSMHRLALGNYTYECKDIIVWPNDKANDLYGEVLSKADVTPQKTPPLKTDAAADKKPKA